MYGTVNMNGIGAEALTVLVPRKFNKVIGGSTTQLTKGMVAVTDFGQRGAASIGGTTRSVAGSTPNYTADRSSSDFYANVTTCDNNAPQAKHKALVYQGTEALADQSTGQFAIQGRVKALVTGDLSDGTDQAIAAGNRLVLSKTLPGALCFASGGEMIQAIALDAMGAGSNGLIDVLLLDTPYLTPTNAAVDGND